jgi:hypothetical protein
MGGSHPATYAASSAAFQQSGKEPFHISLYVSRLQELHHDDYRPHVGVNVAMIGKGASSLKGKMKGTTGGNSSTIEHRSIVTRHRMGHGRHHDYRRVA